MSSKAHSTQSFCALFEAAVALARETDESIKIIYRGQEVTVRPADDMIDVANRWGESAGVRFPCLLETSRDLADEVLVTAQAGDFVFPDPDFDPELNLASDQQ